MPASTAVSEATERSAQLCSWSIRECRLLWVRERETRAEERETEWRGASACLNSDRRRGELSAMEAAQDWKGGSMEEGKARARAFSIIRVCIA